MDHIPTQELTDRLVIASEEQDVLYVLHWLREMKDQECLEEAINNKLADSWKGSTALETIVLQTSFTRIHKIILEILLLAGADTDTEDMLELAMEKNNAGVVDLLLTWGTSGRDSATDTARLLTLPLEDAADFIDLNLLLPQASNPESLTGEGPLPRPPSPALHPPVGLSEGDSTSVSNSLGSGLASNKNESNSFLDSEAPEEPTKAAPSSSPPIPSSPESIQTTLTSSPPQIKTEMSIDPRPPRRDSSFATPSTALRTPSPDSNLAPNPRAPIIPFVPRVRLHIGRIPLKSHPLVIEKLFADIGVDAHLTRCHNKVAYGYTFADVPSESVNFCIQKLNCFNLDGCTITCSLASGQSIQVEQNPFSLPLPVSIPRPPIPIPMPRPPIPIRPSTPARPPLSSTARNLLVVNLPLIETNESRLFLSNLRIFDIFPFPLRDQRVAFVRTTSEVEADRIVSMWNRCVVSGRNLRVVHVGKGLYAKEAIDHFFRKQDELDQPFKEGQTGKTRKLDCFVK